MKEPYRHMEPKTETKPSLYQRFMLFAEEAGVMRQLLMLCGAVVLTIAFIKLPYWFGEFLGKIVCGADDWKPDLDSAGNPKLVDYSIVNWFLGIIILILLWGGYLVSGLVFRKKK